MQKNLIIVILFIGNGCSTTNVSKLVTAMGKDPATVHIRVSNPVYGSLDIFRVCPTTNTPPYKISPDGTIEVK